MAMREMIHDRIIYMRLYIRFPGCIALAFFSVMIDEDLVTGDSWGCGCVEMSFLCYIKGNRVCLLTIPMVCTRCLNISLLDFLLNYFGGLFHFPKQLHIYNPSRVFPRKLVVLAGDHCVGLLVAVAEPSRVSGYQQMFRAVTWLVECVWIVDQSRYPTVPLMY